MSYKSRLANLTKQKLTNAAPGVKGSAVSIAVGFACYHLQYWAASQTWAPKNIFVIPGAMALLGHVLKGKYPAPGVALLGAAGYGLAMAMAINKQQKANGGDAKGLYGGDAAFVGDVRSPEDAQGDGDAAFVTDSL